MPAIGTKLKTLVVVASLLFVPQMAVASGEFECLSPISSGEQKQVLDALDKRYASFADLRAAFDQNSFFAGLGREEMSKGSVEFKKPGMMNWNYEEPKKQSFITDGSTLWFFQPDLNQVTLGDFKQSFNSDLPVSFLLGAARLQSNFNVEQACQSNGGTVLKLKPKDADPNLDEFFLLLRKSDQLPIGAKIIDIAGNETAIVFSDIAVNPGLNAKDFSFVIPRGVDIIDNRAHGTGQ